MTALWLRERHKIESWKTRLQPHLDNIWSSTCHLISFRHVANTRHLSSYFSFPTQKAVEICGNRFQSLLHHATSTPRTRYIPTFHHQELPRPWRKRNLKCTSDGYLRTSPYYQRISRRQSHHLFPHHLQSPHRSRSTKRSTTSSFGLKFH